MGMDPAGVNPNDPRTFNRFAYANNNPYRYVDPDGRTAFPITVLGIAVIAYVALAVDPNRQQRIDSLQKGWKAFTEGLDDGGSNDNDQSSDNEDQGNKPSNDKNDQIKRLTKGEIKKLKESGEDVHDLKGGKNASKRDLFKNGNGDIEVRPKSGGGSGEPTGLNINDF